MADRITPASAPVLGHPYFPTDAVIAGYVANDKDVTELMLVFGAVTGAVIGTALWQTTLSRRPLRPVDRFAAAWFALCAFLHIAFEGYYLIYRHQLPSMSSLFAQLWKEYALSDSRYLTHDIFTISVETITFPLSRSHLQLAWGPLSLLTCIGITRNWRSRHVAQTIVCTAHLYGVALYYLTNWTESRVHGVAYSRPETLYFWVYYVGFNMPWAVVPLGESAPWRRLVIWTQIDKAFGALEQREKRE
ncbi:hypothetical protein FZEAL_8237 [Fusarium zealandicum]|uniref:EXPERA domain-containing protein n=1 Tax=Fusarium zealandicum TaxID=1053134 RepID=A0A8H4UEZ5_9HYPO|nr:hypothetical protein FZEAL_8237 [Fusarium zealandicum]